MFVGIPRFSKRDWRSRKRAKMDVEKKVLKNICLKKLLGFYCFKRNPAMVKSEYLGRILLSRYSRSISQYWANIARGLCGVQALSLVFCLPSCFIAVGLSTIGGRYYGRYENQLGSGRIFENSSG